MSATTPIEIWEKILKYAIAVPLFFDPDPLTNYGQQYLPQYCFEATYWESERNLNSLRRVCRSWDAFLHRYMHRYVRLADICLGRIPMAAAPMAIRFSTKLDLTANTNMKRPFSNMATSWKMLLPPRDPNVTIATADKWKMEILDGTVDSTLHASLVERAPRLQAVIDLRTGYGTQLQAAGIRFLYAIPDWAKRITTPFTLPYLTTLHLAPFPVTTPFKSLDFPRLRHLSIGCFTYGETGVLTRVFGGVSVRGEDFRDKMVEILQALGKNLTTLHYQDSGTTSMVSVTEIWSLIHNVERIQLPYWKGVLLPANHPARIVTIPMDCLGIFMGRGAEKPEKALFDYIPDSTQFLANTLITRMDITWFLALTGRPNVYPYTHRITISIWLARYYAAKRVKFIDSEGWTFNEYLIFLIKSFWKRDPLSAVTRLPRRRVHCLTF